MSEFTDKVVIIVGASGKDNTGQCMARRFAAEGAHVLVSGRRAEPLDELAREIGCAWKVCDFTRKEDIDALVNFAQERYGQVDIGIDDIAEAALWLASDACFMTGQSLQVNGGLTLRRNPTLAEMGASLAGIAES